MQCEIPTRKRQNYRRSAKQWLGLYLPLVLVGLVWLVVSYFKLPFVSYGLCFFTGIFFARTLSVEVWWRGGYIAKGLGILFWIFLGVFFAIQQMLFGFSLFEFSAHLALFFMGDVLYILGLKFAKSEDSGLPFKV